MCSSVCVMIFINSKLAGFYECGDEHLGSIKCWKFLE